MNLIPLTLGADNPLDHVVNHGFITINGWWVWSSHTGNIVLTGIIMLMFFPRWSKFIAGEGVAVASGSARFVPSHTGAHLFEVFCVYLRDTIVKPVLGDKTDKFMPFLWTAFFFILINNLLGLLPILDFFNLIYFIIDYFRGMGGGHHVEAAAGTHAGGLTIIGWNAGEGLLDQHRAPFGATATGNIWVTLALAMMAGAVFLINGFKSLGVKGFMEHMTGGAPKMMWPLMVPIELLSNFLIRPGALAIRLFANMTAGHVLVATMFMFVGMSTRVLPFYGAAPISAVAIIATIAIYFLELFVAVLQAFIFMFLTTIFIGLLSSHGHGAEHDHEHEHGHGHAAAPAH